MTAVFLRESLHSRAASLSPLRAHKHPLGRFGWPNIACLGLSLDTVSLASSLVVCRELDDDDDNDDGGDGPTHDAATVYIFLVTSLAIILTGRQTLALRNTTLLQHYLILSARVPERLTICRHYHSADEREREREKNNGSGSVPAINCSMNCCPLEYRRQDTHSHTHTH